MAEQVVFVVSERGGVRQAVARALRRDMGAHVLPMRGGAAALAWAAVLRPTAVVVHVDEREAGGAELVRRFTAHPETRGVPVVGLAEGPEGRGRALAAGCAEAVALPLDPAALARAVAACARGAAHPGATAAA